MRILATYLQTVARLYFLLTFPAAAAACNCPKAIDKFTNTLPQSAFPFSHRFPPYFFPFISGLQQTLLHCLLIFGLGYGLVSRFEVVGLANAKHFLRLHLSMRNFLVCSAQIMQLICAQFEALLYTHIWQALLTFELVYCIFN